MPYKYFSLSFKSSSQVNLWKEKLYQAHVDALYREIDQASTLDYLLRFAKHSTWCFVKPEDVLEDKIQAESKNLYIENIKIKSNNLNFIFGNVRDRLLNEGYFAFKFTTAENSKLKMQRELGPIVFLIYYPFYFLLRRVLPKLKGFRKICRLLSMPVDRSKAEIIGRLIYKGFNVVSLLELNHETLIVAQTNLADNPSSQKPAPCEGFIFKMKRLGKGGKKIIVYKLRTMHPYAEYAQDYVHKIYGLDVGGKFKNDFRISVCGRFLRKYWLDELPMIYNLLKGDIKLIGVRPISEYYFGLYPEQLQIKRKDHKPGLLPPFYADMPGTFEEIVQSELTYLTKYEKAPYYTDFSYLLKIIKNIVINKARSK